MTSLGAFDFFGIREGCFHQCEGDSGLYNDGTTLPLYRDPKTEKQFQEIGKFFVCVDVCEDGFTGKRIAFIVPMVLMGLIIIGVCLCCCFCKRCYLYRGRKTNQKDAHLLLDSSTTDSLTTKSVGSNTSSEPSGIVRKNWGGLYTISAKMSSKVSDINHRTHSSASVNSWINDEDNSDQGKTVRRNTTKEDPNDKRSRLMDTAHRLGKKLIELDKQAEEIDAIKKEKIRHRSLTHVETTKRKEKI